jgi:cytochrome c biogenesis protein CcmG, thiol:disulfide interchange protein DsbE
MKRILLLVIVMFIITITQAQSIPQATIKTLEGQNISTTEIIQNNGNPVILSFWATWCRPCVQELSAFNEEMIDWEDEFGVKIIAISTDNARSTNRVGPFVSGQGWEFDIYLDANNDFKRAMNVGNVPHTFLLDGEGNIIWQHTSYSPGDEEKLYQELLKYKSGK